MKAIKRYRKALSKIARKLNKVFDNPSVISKEENTLGDFVLNTPEVEGHIEAAQADAKIIDVLEEHADKVEPYLSPDHGGYALPLEERPLAVKKYREAKAKGKVLHKHNWAKANLGIDGATLRRYEKMYPE